jgi:hypothetical protein
MPGILGTQPIKVVRRRFDKNVVWLTISSALVLAGMTILVLPARAQNDLMPANPTPTAGTVVPGGNLAAADDDDDFYETWTDARVSHERNVQTAGMVVLFVIVAATGLRRKLTVRRLHRA